MWNKFEKKSPRSLRGDPVGDTGDGGCSTVEIMRLKEKTLYKGSKCDCKGKPGTEFFPK